MRLWCYIADRGGWGHQLAKVAFECGIEAHVFSGLVPDMRKGDYAFMRIPQWEPECSEGKRLATVLRDRGLRLIPDYFTIMSYEDKVMQYQAYWEWMPTTELFIPDNCGWRDADRFVQKVGLPFISKSREASSSVNVRLVKDMVEARREWQQAMEGDGIPMKIGKGREGRQKGYLLWQKYCKGNPGDYRVVINGERLMMLGRNNAHGSTFASGSGSNWPITEPNEYEQRALNKAEEFFYSFNLKWNGIDLVYDYDEEEFKVLETTLGWSAKAYENCVYFDTKYHGRDVWTLFCEQLKEGVFA